MPLSTNAASAVYFDAPVSGASAATTTPDCASALNLVTPDALLNGFATLLGVLVGAMLAYWLQRRSQKILENDAAQTAGHKLMFVLLQQINTIVLIQRDYVYAHLKNPGRFLSIPATPEFSTSKNVLELPELAFLLQTREGRAVLYEFYLAQENYVEALNQWNLRSSLHLEKIQPALAMSGIRNGDEISEEVLKQAIGIHNFGAIINSTDNCIECLKRAFQKLDKVKISTREYLVSRFGSNDFTDFSTPETYCLSNDLKESGSN
jgi:hypothetical protein